MQLTETTSPGGRIIGRRQCPWCPFAHSHVRQVGGKLPYHYCPSCGHKTLSHNDAQAKLLTVGMRSEPNYGTVPQLARRADDIVVPASMADQARRAAGPWDQLLPSEGCDSHDRSTQPRGRRRRSS